MREFIILILVLSITNGFSQTTSYREIDSLWQQQAHNVKAKVHKFKKAWPHEYFAINTRDSKLLRVTVVAPRDKVLDLFYIDGNLAIAVIRKYTGNKNDWPKGTYYFKNGVLVHKDEERSALIDTDELLVASQNYTERAKSL